MDDELAGFVGARLSNTGFNGFFLGFERSEVLFSLTLEVPAVSTTSGWVVP